MTRLEIYRRSPKELLANSTRAILSVPVLPGPETEASLVAGAVHAANVELEARKLASESSSAEELQRKRLLTQASREAAAQKKTIDKIEAQHHYKGQ